MSKIIVSQSALGTALSASDFLDAKHELYTQAVKKFNELDKSDRARLVVP